jgi:hypothetical protein
MRYIVDKGMPAIKCCVWSVIDKIYKCALYLYASEGVVPWPFDEEMMNMCWEVKAAR